MLKKIAYAMFVGGVLLASVNAAAESSFPAESDVIDYTSRTPDRENSPFPIESTPVDYGVPVARADSDSAIPDQSDSLDYGIRVAKADGDRAIPDQSDSNDYGIRVAA